MTRDLMPFLYTLAAMSLAGGALWCCSWMLGG